MSGIRYTANQFLEAIKDSGGNISLIAERIGCTWRTARDFINKHPTVLEAYDHENESILDIAESLITKNIKLAGDIQKTENKIVDTTDAKWWLSKKRPVYKESLELSGGLSLDLNVPEENVEKWIVILKRTLQSDTGTPSED